MEADKRYEMLNLNTSEQSDLVLYDLLREGKFETFLQRIQDGYCLTAFVLNIMLDNGYADKVDEVLATCKCWQENVFDFLVIYWDREKAEDYWAQNAESSPIFHKLSNEALVRNELWGELRERNAFNVLGKYAPLDVLKEIGAGSYLRPRVLEGLVKAKRFEEAVSFNHTEGYPQAYPELSLYLFKHDIDKFCDAWSGKGRDFEKIYSDLGFASFDDLCQYLYDLGKIDFLIKNTGFLENHGIWEPLVLAKEWYTLFHCKQYDLIDWENWLDNDDRQRVVIVAGIAKNWDFLVKHKAHWQLLKHFRLWCFVKSFF